MPGVRVAANGAFTFIFPGCGTCALKQLFGARKRLKFTCAFEYAVVEVVADPKSRVAHQPIYDRADYLNETMILRRD
jgi:hypothetical protein